MQKSRTKMSKLMLPSSKVFCPYLNIPFPSGFASVIGIKLFFPPKKSCKQEKTQSYLYCILLGTSHTLLTQKSFEFLGLFGLWSNVINTCCCIQVTKYSSENIKQKQAMNALRVYRCRTNSCLVFKMFL